MTIHHEPTDKTPATEAGRRLAARYGKGRVAEDVLAIEAEARADALAADPPALDHAEHYDPDCEECVYLARPVAVHVPADPPALDVERLQWAMRRAHGRRINMTESYAQAIARAYNGDEYEHDARLAREEER